MDELRANSSIQNMVSQHLAACFMAELLFFKAENISNQIKNLDYRWQVYSKCY